MDPGRRTFYLGRYNCIEHLGTGPLGETYRAKIYGVAGFEKQFAVKRLHERLSGDEAFVGRFVQAASSFASLEHRCIARVHEVNAQGAHYYIVVDLVRGIDLRRLLDILQQRGEALAPDAALTIAIDIAEALEHAHGRTNVLPGGVLHLGLTAPSVMVTYEGVVQLVDVGLMAALVRSGWSDDDALTPTLAYLAPEEWRGESIDARADLFSLGVILHELLGGRRVFFSDRASELRAAIDAGPPPPPPGDPRLQEILRRALEPDRDKRFASAAELHAALTSILGGRADRARADLAALVRRLAMPRERRTGAFAAVTLPTGTEASTTPLSKPPPVPASPPRAWSPPTPKPPTGPVLSPVPVHNTLAGIGADDQSLVPIELVEIPGLPTEKALPTVQADEAETNRLPRTDAHEISAPASTAEPPPPPIEALRPSPSAEPASDTPATAANVDGGPTPPPIAAEPSWSPPQLKPIEPSPEPAFATPQAEAPGPVEPARSTVPGVKLPPRANGSRAVLWIAALLASAGALAIYFGLSGNRPQTQPAGGSATQTPSSTSIAFVADLATPTAVASPDLATAIAAKPPTAVPPATPITTPPSTPRPTPPTTPGVAFTITSTPDAAAVFVDGEPRGTTPAALELATGEHQLVVVGEGEKLVKRAVDVAPGGRLDLTLEPAKLPPEVAGSAGLKVRCKTHGELRIFVDGVDSGRSCPNDVRISVKPGMHKVGLYSPRTGELHEGEHEVTEGEYSTRVYVKY